MAASLWPRVVLVPWLSWGQGPGLCPAHHHGSGVSVLCWKGSRSTELGRSDDS